MSLARLIQILGRHVDVETLWYLYTKLQRHCFPRISITLDQRQPTGVQVRWHHQVNMVSKMTETTDSSHHYLVA